MVFEVGVIGHFGGYENFLDGQTVKTKNVTWLLEKEKNFNVRKVDTYFLRKSKIKFLTDMMICLLKSKYIIMLVSVNGMNFLLPCFYYLNKLMKKKIFHYVIGSELLTMASENKKLIKYLNALESNWFEYETGTQHLKNLGVLNAITVPNFKTIIPINEVLKYKSENGVYRFCTFSRVTKEKGISDAIEAIKKINQIYGNKIVHLDIYGQIDDKYLNEFKYLMEENCEYITYKGMVESTKSVEILKEYYALLFPTYWVGEGFAGTIIDSFAAGLPVIASDWNANKEIVQHMEQGIIYPEDNIKSLVDAMLWAIQNEDKMNQMRIESRKEYMKYTPDSILNIINHEFRKGCN